MWYPEPSRNSPKNEAITEDKKNVKMCDICSKNIDHSRRYAVVDCEHDMHYCNSCYALLLKIAKEREEREQQEATLEKLSIEEKQLIGSVTKREKKTSDTIYT